MTEIVVHTLKWREDQAVSKDDVVPASASVMTVVEIDGEVLEDVIAVKVGLDFGFTTTWVQLAGDVTVVSHAKEEWEELGFYSPWRQGLDDNNLISALLAQAERTPEDTGDLKGNS